MPMVLPIFASDEPSRLRERVVGLSVAVSLACGAGLATTCATAAHAADATVPSPWSQLPLKAPPARASSFDWTGFYVGGHVGYARGNARVNLADDDVTNFSHRFGSLIGGLQGGYNYVLPSRLLLGIEADMSFPNYLSPADLPSFPTTPATPIAAKIEFMPTVRGRLGYAFDHWMVYATGGFAWSFGRYLQSPGVFDDPDKALHLHTGWAAGTGAEFAIAPNWTARLEYLYANFGHADVLFPSGTTAGSAYDVHMIRGGLNYKLGSPTAYVPDFAASQTPPHHNPNPPMGSSTHNPPTSSRPPRHFTRRTSASTALRPGRKPERRGPPAPFLASSCGTGASSTTIPSFCRASGCTTRPAP